MVASTIPKCPFYCRNRHVYVGGLTIESLELKKRGAMVFKKCPGQDLSRKKLEDIVCNLPCPNCGSEVEFFFDDKNRICPECGFKVSKSDVQVLKDFGCADWCEAAEKCIGSDLYARLKSAKKHE